MRLAVISDIHGNLLALRAVLQDLDQLGVRSIINLGDMIGYGPDPEECVALIRQRAIPTVLGNHEHAMLRPEHKRWFNDSARIAVDITESHISKESRDWFRTLPTSLAFGNCRFVHGYPPDNSHLYLFNMREERLLKTLDNMKEAVCFVGHTHDLEWVRFDGTTVQRGSLGPGIMTLHSDCRYLLNIGSVGQPRDDYDNRAKYALFDPQAGSCEIRCVDYDWDTVSKRIRALGIPETYANRLLRRS